jgi:hypothetical protein
MKQREIKRVVLKDKDTDDALGCGDCFALIEGEDVFCWYCGAEFNEDYAYNLEDLLKQK